MNRVLRMGMIAICCMVQSDIGVVWAESSQTTPPGSSGATQKPDTASTEHASDESYALWKSCVKMFHPHGYLSGPDLLLLFGPPQNVPQLLQNLKLAWQQDLLLQPSFYDPAILQKFFAGATVTWTKPINPLTQDVGFVVIELGSNVVHGMTLRVESRCWRTDREPVQGRKESTAYILGAVSVSGGPFTGMTLRSVRDVFGPETRNDLDAGNVENGVVHAPTSKGRVIYTDLSKEKAEGGLALGTTFVFPLRSTQSDPTLVDDDTVQNIRMYASRHRLLEK